MAAGGCGRQSSQQQRQPSIWTDRRNSNPVPRPLAIQELNDALNGDVGGLKQKIPIAIESPPEQPTNEGSQRRPKRALAMAISNTNAVIAASDPTK